MQNTRKTHLKRAPQAQYFTYFWVQVRMKTPKLPQRRIFPGFGSSPGLVVSFPAASPSYFFKMSQIQSNRDHRAFNRGKLRGADQLLRCFREPSAGACAAGFSKRPLPGPSKYVKRSPFGALLKRFGPLFCLYMLRGQVMLDHMDVGLYNRIVVSPIQVLIQDSCCLGFTRKTAFELRHEPLENRGGLGGVALMFGQPSKSSSG